MQIPEPTSRTTLGAFLDSLDAKANIWMEMASKRSGAGGSSASNSNPGKASRPISKQNRGRQDGSQQPGVYGPQFFPQQFWPPQGYTSYQFKNPAYQTQKPQYQSSGEPRATAQGALPPSRQPLRITAGNGSDSRNQSQIPRSQQQRPPANARRANRGDKRRAYVVDEADEEHPVEGFHEEQADDEGQGEYYATDENLEYYNTEEGNYEEDETPVNFTVAKESRPRCRHCRKAFPSNNSLHSHLRAGCEKLQAYPAVISSTAATKGSTTVRKSITDPKPLASTASAGSKPLILRSDVDPSPDIGTGYGFRGWNYAKIQASLSADSDPGDVCLDSGAGVSLVDRAFFKAQYSNTPIRTMASPLKVRGLGTNRHETWEYAICDIHLPGTKEGLSATSVLRREVHLVDNLKANMLLGNDIIGPERIILDVAKKIAHIGSTGASIPLDVRSPKSSVQRLVHLRKTTVIPPHAETAIPIHNVGLPASRDFLFEPDGDFDLGMYAHMVDASTTAILVRNDRDVPVKVPRNSRLGRISEIEFPNAFHIQEDEDVRYLAAKEPKSTHRSGWFKKLISACAVAYAAAAAVTSGTNTTPTTSLPKASTPATLPPNSTSEAILPNGVTIYRSEATDTFTKIVEDFPALWHDTGFAKLPEEKWMRIPLKTDWEDRVTGKAKVYPLGVKDRQLVDETFDELHRTGKLSWTNESTPFSYPVFCVWKMVDGESKGRVVVDIRGLNAITQPDAYPLPLQADILTLVRECQFISVIDCSAFFYQWRVHPSDRHKLTVVSHRGQESFNVAVMGYKNSPAYVQRQIDRLLRKLRRFARAYVDDIVVFSHSKEEHEAHLRAVFTVLRENNISIKPTKAFLGYPSVSLLGQKVDSLGLATSEEKLKAIAKLHFPRTLRQLETYLGLTGWLRDYIPHYAGISKPLQDRKTELLRHGPTAGSARRTYSIKTRVQHPTELEKTSFEVLQSILSKPSYLVHVDTKRQLFIDLDASKEFGIGAMLYYVKEAYLKDLQPGKFPPRHAIEPVLFLSRLVTGAESRYWPTELEIAGIVWVLKKVRHIVEASSNTTVIYTDHGSALGIASQTTLTTTSTDKLNLRLVRASDYIQRFNLDIRHKPGKQHIVPDALSRLASANINTPPRNSDEGELDALFTASLVEMDPQFKQRILDGYKSDLNWQKITQVLDSGGEDAATLPFCRGEDGLIFRSDGFTTGDHAYEPRRLCIPHPVVADILQLAHDDGHAGYAKCFEQISASWYIRGLSRYLRDYLKHCPQCLVYQTRRHAPYGSMQPILTPPIPFHTITMDFILALPISRQGFDTAMSVTCKFSKRVTIIPGKATWSAGEWGIALLDRLDIADWGLPKAIISDRDRKFLSDMWTAIFRKLGVKLMYSTAYHPQTDGQSERTNQTVEIALRFHLATMESPADWPLVLPKIQRYFNNAQSATTSKTPNEASYGFTPVQPISLWKPAAEDVQKTSAEIDPLKPSTGASFTSAARARVEVADSIAFAQMSAKHHYDRKHQPLFMKAGDYALIKLHHGYDIPSTAILGAKYSQQFVGPFKVLEKVGRLAYRLELPSHWRIHPVLSIAQLEPVPSGEDPFCRPRPEQPDSIYVKGDTPTVKSYEVERLLNKRQTKTRGPEYLVRWKVQDYEAAMKEATSHLPGRLELPATPATTSARTDLRKPAMKRGWPRKLLTDASAGAASTKAVTLQKVSGRPKKAPTNQAAKNPSTDTSMPRKPVPASPRQSFAVVIPPRKPFADEALVPSAQNSQQRIIPVTSSSANSPPLAAPAPPATGALVRRSDRSR